MALCRLRCSIQQPVSKCFLMYRLQTLAPCFLGFFDRYHFSCCRIQLASLGAVDLLLGVHPEDAWISTNVQYLVAWSEVFAQTITRKGSGTVHPYGRVWTFIAFYCFL